jgi:hypothetical protein
VATQAEALSPGPRGFGSADDRQPLAGLKTSPSRQRGRARTAPCPSVAVDKADRFWPDVTRSWLLASGFAVELPNGRLVPAADGVEVGQALRVPT